MKYRKDFTGDLNETSDTNVARQRTARLELVVKTYGTEAQTLLTISAIERDLKLRGYKTTITNIQSF
jgi:hypothetical protein